jgi:hypothetical protein
MRSDRGRMTLSDELDTLHQILDAARERLAEGNDLAHPTIIAIEAMIAERETLHFLETH